MKDKEFMLNNAFIMLLDIYHHQQCFEINVYSRIFVTSHVRKETKQNQNKNQFVIGAKLKFSNVMKCVFDSFI